MIMMGRVEKIANVGSMTRISGEGMVNIMLINEIKEKASRKFVTSRYTHEDEIGKLHPNM
jgi:hypothetical protein